MKRLACLLALLGALVLVPAKATTTPAPGATPSEQQIRERIQRISSQLHPVTGDVRIPGANAVLHLGTDYYFLPSNEARLVLTEAWDNPPDVAEGVLGLVFPAGRTFADDTWGAVVTYEASGYVSDSDAQSTDYGELMRQMQEAEEGINAERTRQGYPPQHLVGWAQSPVYDSRSHSVVWARNIQYPDTRDNSLNYDIRLLGRRGVLSLNMITVMSKLPETREAARRFASAAEFVPGERYADFQQGDRVAEYGVAGLIAGGVGLAVAKKAGLLAIILAFGKKIAIFVIAGIAMLWRRIKGLFGGRTEEEEAPVYYEPVAEPEPEPAPLAVESVADEAPPTDSPPNPTPS